MSESPPHVDLWSRDGFAGVNAIGLRAGYTPDYLRVEGLHAPRRISLASVETQDSLDASALPTPIMTSRCGITVSVSRRRAPMPHTFRNTEADELHFVQANSARYETEFGTLDVAAGEMVYLPRSLAYRVTPSEDGLITLILESPEPLRFDTPAPFGMINFGTALRYASIPQPSPPGPAREHVLILKSDDGLTRFVKPVDPLVALAQVGGACPVWALKLADVQPLSYGGLGGPPAQFLSARDGSTLIFTLSARASTLRPPVHHNADFDELILYSEGPGAWGAVTEPGTLCHTPKGVTHHGPSEDVPEGYQALLIETRATLRFTPTAQPHARLMETNQYGIHPSEDATSDHQGRLDPTGGKK